MPIKLNLVSPCGDCGTKEGILNNRNNRPTRLKAEKFGFPPGVTICGTCYDKHRRRLVARLAKAEAKCSDGIISSMP